MTETLKETPSQTAGPYVHIGLMPQHAGLSTPKALGKPPVISQERGHPIRVEGIVRDGAGASVKDILIEVWQADASGVYQSPPNDGFRGWFRVAGDFDTGAWAFDTIKPGAVDGAAPLIQLWLVARGINIGLTTRLYFGDEQAANAADPVLQMVDPARRDTLIAAVSSDDPQTYRFEIQLQGESETVFFDV